MGDCFQGVKMALEAKMIGRAYPFVVQSNYLNTMYRITGEPYIRQFTLKMVLVVF